MKRAKVDMYGITRLRYKKASHGWRIRLGRDKNGLAIFQKTVHDYLYDNSEQSLLKALEIRDRHRARLIDEKLLTDTRGRHSAPRTYFISFSKHIVKALDTVGIINKPNGFIVSWSEIPINGPGNCRKFFNIKNYDNDFYETFLHAFHFRVEKEQMVYGFSVKDGRDLWKSYNELMRIKGE